jgi:hypothetical protein
MKRYTRDIGFPGMLAQPGCTKVWRMRRHGADEGEYQVITVWDSMESLERFKSSDAMRELSARCRRTDDPALCRSPVCGGPGLRVSRAGNAALSSDGQRTTQARCRDQRCWRGRSSRQFQRASHGQGATLAEDV